MLQQRLTEYPCTHGQLCVVITPSKAPDSEIYELEPLINRIVVPILKLFNYRSELVQSPSFRPPAYAHQLDDLLASRLTVADLTGADPNVCFEVGVRYLSGRPLVCFIREGMSPPEVLAHLRPISYSPTDPHPAIREFADRLKRISEDHPTEGRPLFEVQCQGRSGVIMGGFKLDRQSLRELEARVIKRADTCDCGRSGNGKASFSPPTTGRRRDRH